MDDEKYQDLWNRQEKLEERLRDVEQKQAGTVVYIKEIKEDLQEIKAELKKINSCDIKSSFWFSDSGKFLIRTLCIIGTIIVMAAIGMNYFKEYLQAVIK